MRGGLVRAAVAVVALTTGFAGAGSPADGAAGAARRAPEWAGVVTLARGSGLGVPDAVVDRLGTTTVVWSRAGRVLAVRRSAAGHVGPVVRLGRGRAPQAGVDGRGTVTVIWLRTPSGQGTRLRSARHRATGGWFARRPLSPAVPAQQALSRGAFEPALAVGHDGAVVVTWLRGVDDSAVARARARYFDPGTGWEPASTLSGVETRTPAVAVGTDGHAVVVFTRFARALAALHRSGGGWTTPVLVGRHVEPPQVAMDDAGDATVVWSALEADGAFRPEAVTRPADGSWTVPVTLDPVASGAEPVVGCGPLGRCRVAWARPDGQVVASSRTVTSAGGSWSAPNEVAPAGATVLATPPYVGLAIARSGAALLAWTRVDTGRRVVEAAHRPAHAPWGVPVRVSPAGAGAAAAAPFVSVGHVGLAWRGTGPQGVQRIQLRVLER